ncbi:serine beta-lactamase-like protein LACTB, mitochondrial isoform X2 [Amphibalanus amphitrite]|nr:serine beta-lactamase-like protein LACTB, mitochondrial isoform X2 [Amphibalanus amphitrite]XP_043226003.1 serine beta-lactamase-like protein LACTB, mitochondrial isoform X2 [Amphibalanus amphitrite]
MLPQLLKAGAALAATTAAVTLGKGYFGTLQSEDPSSTTSADQEASWPGDLDHTKLEKIKDAARELVLRKKEECGAPGVTIAVSKNGRPVWAEGFGYADVENFTPMTPRHVLRIASISKPITMALVARAMDAGLLDASHTVHHYLPHYPRHSVDGEQVDMTIDQIATHQAGIRHYHKKPDAHIMKQNSENSKKKKLAHEVLEHESKRRSNSGDDKESAGRPDFADTDSEKPDSGEKKIQSEKKQTEPVPAKEFHTTDKYDNVGEALSVFKDDELIHKPGSDFHYSTHGYTLISAVLEAATGARFRDQLRRMFYAMDLRSTYVDENDTIIRNRSRYYVRGKDGKLQNAQHVDNSWKIAGGGLLSTPTDLCRFADIMLYSWQADEGAQPAGYLRPATARWLWTPAPPPPPPTGRRRRPWTPNRFARGWHVGREQPELGAGPGAAMVAYHTGGAAGCSSILLVRPDGQQTGNDGRPRGVSVAVIANAQDVSLREVADDVARLFAE